MPVCAAELSRIDACVVQVMHRFCFAHFAIMTSRLALAFGMACCGPTSPTFLSPSDCSTVYISSSTQRLLPQPGEIHPTKATFQALRSPWQTSTGRHLGLDVGLSSQSRCLCVSQLRLVLTLCSSQVLHKCRYLLYHKQRSSLWRSYYSNER